MAGRTALLIIALVAFCPDTVSTKCACFAFRRPAAGPAADERQPIRLTKKAEQ